MILISSDKSEIPRVDSGPVTPLLHLTPVLPSPVFPVWSIQFTSGTIAPLLSTLYSPVKYKNTK